MRSSVFLKGLLFLSMFLGGATAWLYAATPAMIMDNTIPMILGIDARLIAAAITIMGLGGILNLLAQPHRQ